MSSSGHAIKAVQADPDHFPALLQYLRARSSLPNFPTDNDLAVSERALKLAPSLANLRFESATYLERRGRYAEALARLAPLAADPHGGDLAASARERMPAIDALLQQKQQP